MNAGAAAEVQTLWELDAGRNAFDGTKRKVKNAGWQPALRRNKRDPSLRSG